jgi:hypothetical protein
MPIRKAFQWSQASPRRQQGSHKGVDPWEGGQFGSYAERAVLESGAVR